MLVKLIVHLFSQHDYVALQSHAFDVMSFFPEVTSQPWHISVCDIMTRSLVSSAQPCTGRSSSLRVTRVLLGQHLQQAFHKRLSDLDKHVRELHRC